MEIIEKQDEIVIRESVKGIDDYERLREVLYQKNRDGAKEITIKFVEATYLSSSVVGLLLKLKEIDRIEFEILTTQAKLWKLFYELDLIDVLNVKRASR